jgi:hypothetical protein
VQSQRPGVGADRGSAVRLYRPQVERAEARLEALKADVQRRDLFGSSVQGSFGASAAAGSARSGESDEDHAMLQQTVQSLERSSGYLNDVSARVCFCGFGRGAPG